MYGYVDIDHAPDLDKRKSTSGFVFTLAGGCICWKAVLQKCISLSSTKVEYVAGATAAEEAVWLGRLTTEMGLKQGSLGLHCDSQSAMALAESQKVDSRLKHTDLRYHFIRQMVEEDKIHLIDIDTRDNPADVFTKVIPLELYTKHKKTLQILQMVD